MTTPLRIGISGPNGRMGAALVELVDAASDLEVTARITLPNESGGLPLSKWGNDPCDVLIDFTHREAVADHAEWTARHGVAWVLGTTGLTPEDHAHVAEAAKHTLVFQASNFSLGVALLTDLAARAARVLGLDADVEIIEAHHHHKKDAPSGTALSVAKAIATARGQDFEAVRCDGRSGICGERPRGEIGIHAIRLGDVVGEHEVQLAWPLERIKISHEARDRKVFAHGALRAARFAAERRAAGDTGWVGMAELLA